MAFSWNQMSRLVSPAGLRAVLTVKPTLAVGGRYFGKSCIMHSKRVDDLNLVREESAYLTHKMREEGEEGGRVRRKREGGREWKEGTDRREDGEKKGCMKRHKEEHETSGQQQRYAAHPYR